MTFSEISIYLCPGMSMVPSPNYQPIPDEKHMKRYTRFNITSQGNNSIVSFS